MISVFAIPAVNSILRRNSWALQALQPYAGKTVRFVCPPVMLSLTVSHTGEVTATSATTTPHATIDVTPGVMLRMLARDETVWNEIDVTGDTDFATVINHVWRNLQWDIEEDLARVFGDIAAHRMVETGRTLEQWRAQSFDNLARSFAEYWTEERPLIAHARDVERFNADVDRLRDDLARLEKRIEPLLNRHGRQERQ